MGGAVGEEGSRYGKVAAGGTKVGVEAGVVSIGAALKWGSTENSPQPHV